MAVCTIERAIELRNLEGKATLEDTYKILKETGKCVVVRPTGFGKSYMLAHITQRYSKSLYVYPTEVIKFNVERDYCNVLKETTFISYRALLEIFKRGQLRDFLDYSCFDLLMFDEVHHIGAKKFRGTYDIIKTALEELNMDILGVTATPDRMDGYDYLSELFDNHRTYEYTLHDCIQSGIMFKPNYIFAQFDTDKALRDFKTASDKLKRAFRGDRDKLESVLKQKEIEIANLVNAPNVIRNSYLKMYDKPEYLKFIVFFASIQILNDTYKDIEGWFKEAFPDMTVNSLIITSEQERRTNIKFLPQLVYQGMKIDLIMCVDMLNMGYHIDDISGIVMIRGTESDIVYKQQIGRCMSVTARQAPIIFDFVNNYSIHPYFIDDTKSNSDSVNEKEYKFGELEIQDLVIEDKIASYAGLLAKLAELSRYGIEKEVIFLYQDRCMPCYLVAEKLSITRKDVIGILRRNKIKVEDESALKTFGIDARKLYIIDKVKEVSAVEKFSESYWSDVQ